MSAFADILKRLDALMEGQNAAQRSVPQLPAEFKPRDISPVLGAPEKKHPTSGYFVGGESQGDVKEYMPMPEPITDDTVMELSPDTLARYRAAAMQDKQFNLRGIAQANQMSRSKQSEKDWDAAEEWDDEARFFRSVNAKRNRGIRRADRGMAKASAAGSDVEEGTQKKPNATTRHLRDYPVSDKDVAKPVKKPEKKKPEQGVAEMDKSQPSHGRDGKISHSTYGSRDKKGSDYFKGKEASGKAITAKQASKDALDILKKQGVAEGTKTASDTVMELSPDTLARYRAAAKADKAFNQRGIDAAMSLAARDQAPGRAEWEDEAEFLKSVNAKRDRGLKRAGDDINEISDFKRREIEHELRHEAPNNYQVNIDGRRWKVFGDRAHAQAVARKLQAKGKKVDIHVTGAAVSESATTEDVVSKGGKNLGDYLQDVAKIIKKDPELLDRVAQELDKLGPAVKTLHTDDGHEIKIHGNEDDGFRISIKNRTAKGRFRDLDEARMAVELFVARRRKHSADNSDYVDEK